MKPILLPVTLSLGLLGPPSIALSGEIEPDNSGRNTRDREEGAVTPGDQSNSEGDRRITQEIRKAVVSHEDLSINAQNVKIITVGGVVTLRGPVDSADEKATIATMARSVAGVVAVDNQLEIARQ